MQQEKTDLEIEQLQEQLTVLNQRMELLAQEGKYVLAESTKQNAEKLKMEIESKLKKGLKTEHKQSTK